MKNDLTKGNTINMLSTKKAEGWVGVVSKFFNASMGPRIFLSKREVLISPPFPQQVFVNISQKKWRCLCLSITKSSLSIPK